MGVEVGRRADEGDVLGLLDEDESFIAASLPINLRKHKSGESEARRDFLSRTGSRLRTQLCAEFLYLLSLRYDSADTSSRCQVVDIVCLTKASTTTTHCSSIDSSFLGGSAADLPNLDGMSAVVYTACTNAARCGY